MSDKGTKISNAVVAVTAAIPVLEAVAIALAPGAAAAIATAANITRGVVAGVPEAVALWQQFQSGNVPTQAELDAYAAVENTAYETVMADIQAKLAITP